LSRICKHQASVVFAARQDFIVERHEVFHVFCHQAAMFLGRPIQKMPICKLAPGETSINDMEDVVPVSHPQLPHIAYVSSSSIKNNNQGPPC